MSDVTEAKKKGLDGKECWDGYKLAGTKKKGGKTVDNCVKVDEAKVDAGKSPETKEKDRNVRRFGVSHSVAAHGKLRRALHRSDRGDKKKKGDKSQYVEMEGTSYGLYKGDGKAKGAMKDYLDKKAKKLSAEKKKQKPEYKNNPAFGDASHHSNAKNKIDEEGYDRMRDDRLVKYGIGHDGSDRKSTPSKRTPDNKKIKGKTALQKETEKKYGKGKSALDIVKAKITAKHGKGAIMKNEEVISELSSDTLQKASKAADIDRGKKAVAGDKEGAKKRVKQASRFFKAASSKRKQENTQENVIKGYSKGGEVKAPRTQKGAMAYDGPNKERSEAADRVKAKTKAKMNKEEYTVTNADKKGNTPAYQAYKAGKKNAKTGKPLYKAADHMKESRPPGYWDYHEPEGLKRFSDFLSEGNPTTRMLSKSKSQQTGNISADRGTDAKKNKESRKGLEKDLKKKGIGYKKGTGEYKYDDGSKGREVSYQTTPAKGMSKRRFGKTMRRLGRKHGQESVITKDKNKPARLHDTESKKPGKSVNIGKSKPGKHPSGQGETSGTKVRGKKLSKTTNKPSYHYG